MYARGASTISPRKRRRSRSPSARRRPRRADGRLGAEHQSRDGRIRHEEPHDDGAAPVEVPEGCAVIVSNVDRSVTSRHLRDVFSHFALLPTGAAPLLMHTQRKHAPAGTRPSAPFRYAESGGWLSPTEEMRWRGGGEDTLSSEAFVVMFADSQTARRAVDAMDGGWINGRVVHVQCL